MYGKVFSYPPMIGGHLQGSGYIPMLELGLSPYTYKTTVRLSIKDMISTLLFTGAEESEVESYCTSCILAFYISYTLILRLSCYFGPPQNCTYY